MSDIRTGIAIWASRHISPKVAGPYAQALQATGAIDYAPMLMPTEPEATIEASAEICRLIKEVP